jgi:NTE family protein
MSGRPRVGRKALNLALQGGGAHGAFTWGVLDRFLEDDRILIEGISGTSAGAMNAVIVADGFDEGGRDGARRALRSFWLAVSDAARCSPIQRSLFDVLMGNWNLDNSPGYLFNDLLSRVASPYELNPLNINPLRDLLLAEVDFERVRRCRCMKIFVSATNVENGRVKVFTRGELSADAVLASACLPFFFQAVEIEGVPYWDGGYMGNPVLFPFFEECECDDVVIVQINPLSRPGTPRTAREILDRVNEITFNASLMKEYRAINFVRRLIDQGRLDPQEYRPPRIHIVADDETLVPLGVSSKLNTERAFLEHLFETGRGAANGWLATNFERLGVESTVDLHALFEG